jgi:CBS domain-containing protein
MSLKWYQRPRLVALNTGTPVLEAARAIENNNIGAVVVQDKGAVVGIVTDRDLTVRVVGRGPDPKTPPLADVMTTPVVILSLRTARAMRFGSCKNGTYDGYLSWKESGSSAW